MRRSLVLFLMVWSLSAPSDEGLFRIKDTRVPGAIEIASESVLQLVLLGNPRRITRAEYPAYLGSAAGENFILALTQKKIAGCAQRGDAYCDIPYQSYGSAFLTDDGKVLWTAKHVIESQLGRPVVFELYSSAGEKVFDTSDTKDQATLLFAGDPRMIQKRHEQNFIIEPGISEQCSDYAKFRLNRNLSIRALRIASRRPQGSDRVYTVGYANVSLRNPSSPGSAQTRSRVAIGQMANYIDPSPNENSQQRQDRITTENFIAQHLLTMSLDGLPGQSGSPVLNDSGEVVGIFIAGNATIADRGALKGIAPHFEGISKNGH